MLDSLLPFSLDSLSPFHICHHGFFSRVYNSGGELLSSVYILSKLTPPYLLCDREAGITYVQQYNMYMFA